MPPPSSFSFGRTSDQDATDAIAAAAAAAMLLLTTNLDEAQLMEGSGQPNLRKLQKHADNILITLTWISKKGQGASERFNGDATNRRTIDRSHGDHTKQRHLVMPPAHAW